MTAGNFLTSPSFALSDHFSCNSAHLRPYFCSVALHHCSIGKLMEQDDETEIFVVTSVFGGGVGAFVFWKVAVAPLKRHVWKQFVRSSILIRVQCVLSDLKKYHHTHIAINGTEMKLVWRIGVMIGSYLIACIVSSLLVLICLFIFLPTENFMLHELSVFGLVGVAIILTIMFVFLPASAAILYFEMTGNPGWAVHALAGALSGFFALLISTLTFGGTFDAWYYAFFFTALVVAAGAVGGVVYWKLAVSGLVPDSSYSKQSKLERG